MDEESDAELEPAPKAKNAPFKPDVITVVKVRGRHLRWRPQRHAMSYRCSARRTSPCRRPRSTSR